MARFVRATYRGSVLEEVARTSRIGANISREAAARPSVSWPDLVRPSTTLPQPAAQVVDGPDKPGHDTEAAAVPDSPYVSAYADKPGHDVGSGSVDQNPLRATSIAK